MIPNDTEFEESQDLTTLLESLSSVQLDYVAERIFTRTDKAAAEAIGVTRVTVSRWKRDGAPLDLIVRLCKQDAVALARAKLQRLGPKAVRTIEEEMEKPRGAKRIDAAFGVLDRIGLVKGQAVDVTSGGKEMGHVTIILPDKGRDGERIDD